MATRRTLATVLAAALLLAGCQSVQAPEAARYAVSNEVELLGGVYRKSGPHWLAVTKGAVLTPNPEGGYCASSNAPKISATGAYVCLYADNDSGNFNRAVLFSNASVLEQFLLRDALPFRQIEPAVWPGSLPQA